MKPTYPDVRSLGLGLLAAVLCCNCATVPAFRSQETIRLFNGENLEGFYTFIKDRGRNTDPKGVFSVRDGLLCISGEEWGCVTSVDTFQNFHLIAEFKWGERTWEPRENNARDSGILVHSVGEDGAYGGIWMSGIECQIIEGGTGDFIVVGDGSESFSVTSPLKKDAEGEPAVYKQDGVLGTRNGGRVDWFARDEDWQDVKGFRGQYDIESPVGEWNRLECIADGNTLTVKLNGVVVNQAFAVRPQSGRIQIQSEGAEIFFRRVDITPLRSDHYRLIYNADANTNFIFDKPPMAPADVHKYVDEVADVGATTYLISPNWGMVMNYPTEVGDMIGQYATPAQAEAFNEDAPEVSHERGIANLRALIAAGHDPLGLVIDRAHERGMEAFITFRLNEVHAVEKEDSLIFSRFWKDHPEWRIGKAGDPLAKVYTDILGINVHPIVAGWLPGGLNFAVPEVRAHRLAQLRECCERYDIDGLELDFQRFPIYFKPGEETLHVSTMTAWMREVRAMTEEIAEKRGRPLLLCARVMARPPQNLAIGIDPVSWAGEGLLDFVTVSHYLRNDHPLPIHQYRELLPKGMPIYASIEYATSTNGYRRIARQLWKDGVDGISLFNFFATRPRKEPPFAVIQELGSPASLEVVLD